MIINPASSLFLSRVSLAKSHQGWRPDPAIDGMKRRRDGWRIDVHVDGDTSGERERAGRLGSTRTGSNPSRLSFASRNPPSRKGTDQRTDGQAFTTMQTVFGVYHGSGAFCELQQEAISRAQEIALI